MNELSDKYREALTFICKELYGHEDLSKAFVYAPYIELKLTPPVLDRKEKTKMTCAELIEKLKTLPQDLPITIVDDDLELSDLSERNVFIINVDGKKSIAIGWSETLDYYAE